MSHRSLAQAHLLPHFTRPSAWAAEELPVLERGEGCYVWDTDGNRWLDGLAGLFCVNLGHGRADLGAVAAEQMGRLAYASNWGFASPPAAEAAAMIADLAPGDLDEVFFVSTGSEAVESALKFARAHHVARGEPDRTKVISREWSYHGTSIAALALTGIPRFREAYGPMLPPIFRHVTTTRGWGPGGDAAGAAELPCVQAVEEAILEEGPETVAMVIAEPVQNGGGALVPPDGYWPEMRRICNRHGVLLCADEVINGFGRVGHWFASERYGAEPDLVTFAKGVTSAYSPLGGLLVRRPLVEALWASDLGWYPHGTTFGGHPVSCAVAVANIAAMRDEGIMGHVLEHEVHLGDGLRALGDAHDCLKEARGAGYLWAVELMASRAEGRELTEADAQALRYEVLPAFIRESGLLIRVDDRGATMLTISPPLVADREVLDDLVARVDTILARTGSWLGGAR